jgi:hypothetical protein
MFVVKDFWLGLFVAILSGFSSALLSLTGKKVFFVKNTMFMYVKNYVVGVHEASHSAISGTPSVWKFVGGIYIFSFQTWLFSFVN